MHQLNSSGDVAISFPTKVTGDNTAIELRVIRQLLEAVLFEKVTDYTYRENAFHFVLGGHQYWAQGKTSGFSRIRLDTELMLTKPLNNKQASWQVINLHQLVNDLPTSDAVKNKLSHQLQQTVKLCRWNNQHLPRPKSRRGFTYSQLESAIDEGHPYHPCFKARTGFDEDDHRAYGPESAKPFQLHWLAIRRCYLKRRLKPSPEHLFWQQELGDSTLLSLQSKLSEQCDDVTAFSFMPIHPWQWFHLKEKLSAALENAQLYYLGPAGDEYQASISVRTLLNVTNPSKANIKLPLTMVNTSSLRTIESHSICTAPVLSHWLNQLVSSDTYLNERMTLLAEYAGVRLADDGATSQPWVKELDEQVGVIFRESLNGYFDEKNVIPFVALSVIEQDDKPFIDPWIQQHGCANWLKQLIDTTIIPVWHLLVHHGIALEAHGQNMLVAHTQGWPEKVIMRDFHESLEFVYHYLAQPELAPIFGELETCYSNAKPNQYYWMENVEALRELIVDTLFVFNLTDLAVLLEKFYDYKEDDFWQCVYQSFQDYERSGLTDPSRIAKINIFEPTINTESLLIKKFGDSRVTELHHAIENSLSIKRPNLTPSTPPQFLESSPCLP